MEDTVRPERNRLAILAAFAAIYLIWGSTYLAIRIGLETMPPFLLAGTRFMVAGTLLYAWLRLRGVPRPTDAQWWQAALTGTLMLVCGVGGVTWAEQRVPSGAAALLAATVPMWMTMIDTWVLRCSRGGAPVVAGLAVGLAGVAVLVGTSHSDLEAIDPVGAAVILGATVAWSVGSLRSRRANLPEQPAMTVAVQMVAGGVVLLVLSSVLREWQHGFALSEVSLRSATALVYLAVVGSMVALCAYVWLLRQVAAPTVATYAFVNPVVAVFLGWSLAEEAVGPRVMIATSLIVGAVALIQSMQWRRAAVAERWAGHGMERLELPGAVPAAGPADVLPGRTTSAATGAATTPAYCAGEVATQRTVPTPGVPSFEGLPMPGAPSGGEGERNDIPGHSCGESR
jgi:drug/metabolite transporter (DMT)-like permease